MIRRASLLLAFLSVALAPAPAAAQWLLTPFIGPNFGADTPDDPKVTFGGSVGWMGGGALGFEIDFAHSPDFFGIAGIPDFEFIDSSLTTVMANAVVRIPLMGSGSHQGVRPYATAGIGVIRSDVEQQQGFFEASENRLGFNIGVGTTVFFSERIGARGDVRYFRHAEDIDDREFSLGEGRFDFWRGSVGLTFRF